MTGTRSTLPLRTRRLILRAMRIDDAPVLAAYRDDPDISRFQSWPIPFTLDDARRFVAEEAELTWPVYGQWYQIAVEHDGLMIGDVGVNRSADGLEAVMGFTLAPQHQGHGYATEAVAAIVDLLFAEGVRRVTATVDPANEPSIRVLERVGFRHERTDRGSTVVRGEVVDDAHYAISRRRPRSADSP